MTLKYTLEDPSATFSRGKAHDAGWDLTACSVHATVDGKYYVYTGVRVAIPEGYVGLLVPRSSIVKKEAYLSNSVGIIDSNYRGAIVAVFTAEKPPYEVGERCCQLVVVPYLMDAEKVEFLSGETERGSQGFGSSGK
jgi:dUTP pyrophosphatase